MRQSWCFGASMTWADTMASMAACYRHPDTEAAVVCQRCERPIGPECMNPAAVGFQCPECVQHAMKRTRQRDLPHGGTRSARPELSSIVLIVINAVAYAAMMIAGGTKSAVFRSLALIPQGTCSDANYFYAAAKSQCAGQGLVWQDGLATGAWWQAITGAFMHASPMHILFNMMALWFLGPQLERILGRWRFLAIYFASALSASALVMWFSAPYVPTVGASGAIFGLMAATLVVAIKHKGDVTGILGWLAANVLITVLGASFISWQGHLGGFIGGLLTSLAVVFLPKDSKALQWVLVAVVVLGAVAAIVARAMQLA